MRALILLFIISAIQLNAQQNSLEVVKKYALEYEPTPEEGMITTLKPVPLSIVEEFQKLRVKNVAYEQHLALIFAKIYRYHLTCCHQSYELRTENIYFITSEDPLVYELMTLSKKYADNEFVEFLSSGVILNILDERSELLRYEPLKNEFQKIKEIKAKIEKGDL